MLNKIVAWLCVAPLSACVSYGESVSYAVWNHRTDVELIDATLEVNGKILDGGPGGTYFPRPKDAPGWSLGGSAKLPDANHAVPAVAYMSWKIPTKQPDGSTTGVLVGPIQVPLRSRVPMDVLRKVKASERYYLEIGVSAGIEPVLVRWRLIDMQPPPGEVGAREVHRGGDW